LSVYSSSNKKHIAVLGSTGSVGTQVLSVISSYPDQFNVVGLTADSNWERLLSQSNEFCIEWAMLSDQDAKKEAFPMFKREGIDLLESNENLKLRFNQGKLDLLVGCSSGTEALSVIWKALKDGISVALANKEILIVAGHLLKEAARESGAKIIPMDSEHAAIDRALRSIGNHHKELKRIIITSSGGPFRTLPKSDFHSVPMEQVMDHPVWKMGQKITVDSATLINKGFELIEACVLFDVPMDRLDVWIHPEGYVHGAIELTDGHMVWVLSNPDMCFPIGYALFYPDIPFKPKSRFVPFGKRFSFFPPDEERFPALRLARNAFSRSIFSVIWLVGANKVLVDSFLRETIRFVDIISYLEQIMEKVNYLEQLRTDTVDSVQNLLDRVDELTRAFLKHKEINNL